MPAQMPPNVECFRIHLQLTEGKIQNSLLSRLDLYQQYQYLLRIVGLHQKLGHRCCQVSTEGGTTTDLLLSLRQSSAVCWSFRVHLPPNMRYIPKSRYTPHTSRILKYRSRLLRRSWTLGKYQQQASAGDKAKNRGRSDQHLVVYAITRQPSPGIVMLTVAHHGPKQAEQ